MPIRFRCVYCDRLLGIARRKAGAVVNCPHCSEKLIVPTPEPGADEGTEEAKGTAEDKALDATAGPQLFERSDFDHLLQPEPTFRSGEDEPIPTTAPSRPSELPPQAVAYAPQPYPMHSSLPVPAPAPINQPPGFYISSSKLTWLSVAAVVLLAAAFGLGLIVGRMMKS